MFHVPLVLQSSTSEIFEKQSWHEQCELSLCPSLLLYLYPQLSFSIYTLNSSVTCYRQSIKPPPPPPPLLLLLYLHAQLSFSPGYSAHAPCTFRRERERERAEQRGQSERDHAIVDARIGVDADFDAGVTHIIDRHVHISLIHAPCTKACQMLSARARERARAMRDGVGGKEGGREGGRERERDTETEREQERAREMER